MKEKLKQAAQLLGQAGGKTRAAKLPAERVQEIGRAGAESRWGRRCSRCNQRSKEGESLPGEWICPACFRQVIGGC